MAKYEPFDCEKLLELKTDQLDNLVKECELHIERLRNEIVKTYAEAQPYIMKLSHLKRQLRHAIEKMDAAKTFLSIDRNSSLVASVDLGHLKVEVKRDEAGLDIEEPRLVDRSIDGPTDRPTTGKFKSQLIANWAKKSLEQAQKKPTKPQPQKQSQIPLRRSITEFRR